MIFFEYNEDLLLLQTSYDLLLLSEISVKIDENNAELKRIFKNYYGVSL